MPPSPSGGHTGLPGSGGSGEEGDRPQVTRMQCVTSMCQGRCAHAISSGQGVDILAASIPRCPPLHLYSTTHGGEPIVNQCQAEHHHHRFHPIEDETGAPGSPKTWGEFQRQKETPTLCVSHLPEPPLLVQLALHVTEAYKCSMNDQDTSTLTPALQLKDRVTA